MSVYTRVKPEELRDLLAAYAIGELQDYRGISAGVTNTNYFVDTSAGRWVLTLFEQLDATELPFFLQLMDHLSASGVPSAHPVARRDGRFLCELSGKPATLVYCLQGASVEQPGVRHCAAIGQVMVGMHAAGKSFDQRRANSTGLEWMHAARDELANRLDGDDLTLLDDELAFQDAQDYEQLPAGIIHADLFRDNVLFAGEQITGVIDFYYACHDVLLFDLAVVCNDWCISDNGSFMDDNWIALRRAYARQRAFTYAELRSWPALLRAAALRFWISRLADWHFPRAAPDTHLKNPLTFRRILLAHRQAAPLLEQG